MTIDLMMSNSPVLERINARLGDKEDSTCNYMTSNGRFKPLEVLLVKRFRSSKLRSR